MCNATTEIYSPGLLRLQGYSENISFNEKGTDEVKQVKTCRHNCYDPIFLSSFGVRYY